MTHRNSREEIRERADLAGEHRVGDMGQLVLALAFAVIWGVDTFFLGYTTFLNDVVSLFVRIPLGLLALILSGYLSRTGLRIVFGEVREQPAVIRKSVFGIVRHPIYLGEILLYLGLLFLSISLAALVVWVIAVLFLHFISRHEEKLLLEKYGDAYRQYMDEVPMWLPRLRKR